MHKASVPLKVWRGQFGRKYSDRNNLSPTKLDKLYKDNYGINRSELNKIFLRRFSRSMRILEIGSNVGNQMACLKKLGFKNLYGIEPQAYALRLSKKKRSGAKIIAGDALSIPFKDNSFDLVFTSGVLSHIRPQDIKEAIKEIYRCSSKYIWAFEGYCERYTELLYRRRRGLLWKTDFAKLYLGLFKNLKLIKEKRLKYLYSKNIDAMFLLKKLK